MDMSLGHALPLNQYERPAGTACTEPRREEVPQVCVLPDFEVDARTDARSAALGPAVPDRTATRALTLATLERLE